MAQKLPPKDKNLERVNRGRFSKCMRCGNPMRGVFSWELRAICEDCDLDKPDGDKCT